VPSGASTQADAQVEEGEHDLAVARARQSLDAALATLGAEDRLMVSMRFLDGHSVADIARTFRVEQKPLYRRLERSLSALKRGLEASGITGATVRDLVTGGE
jgi:DNA-directed RNA polymerase specialized sigma24 family protein